MGLQYVRGTMSAMATTPVWFGEYVPTADERVLMTGVSWESYQTMLRIRGERPQPRMAYLDGVLELMTTSRFHESIKKFVAILIETYMLECEIQFRGLGNMTMQEKLKEAGLEPDECYLFGRDRAEDEWPDLAVEIVWTSGGIDKLEAYRRIGIREVWFWKRDAIGVFVLRDDAYVEQPASEQLPELDLAFVCSLVGRPTVNDAVAELRKALAARS
jgi:Uma2 family endonuclease